MENIELTEGQIIWLHKDMSNSSQVEVISQTPKRHFTTVKADNFEWQVMTYRLSIQK